MNLRNSANRMNIAHVIGPHLKALIQLLSYDFPEYNMKLQTTKCLNTGILVCLSLLGMKGLELVNYCDSNMTTTRHKQGQDNNIDVLQDLNKHLFSTRERKSQLFYILLTDGYFPKPGDKNIYFPGHVIIIEKHFDEKVNKHIYVLHQSYINEYDLHTFAKTSKTYFTKEELEKHIQGIRLALTSPTWSPSVAQAWKNLTNVDTSTFLSSNSYQQFFICFRKYPMVSYLKPLKRYVTKKLVSLKYNKAANVNNISMSALTNNEMIVHLQKLHGKLSL